MNILNLEVISIGAIDDSRIAAKFTNSNKRVELVAPGVGILSTFFNNYYYASLCGTSMATPHVSGTLALLKEWARSYFRRDLTESEIFGKIIKNTTELNMKRKYLGIYKYIH